ncbi:MAG: hypothetical protein AAGC95_12640 [Pseudomonadota bacterium]
MGQITVFNTVKGGFRAATPIFAATCLVGLAACVGNISPELKEAPAYSQGYGDGCASARERSKNFGVKSTRDDELFASDKAYEAGWRQGYIACSEPPQTQDLEGADRDNYLGR